MTLNHALLALIAAGAVIGMALPAAAQDLYTGGAPTAEALGWRVGTQAYSFNRFSFYEAVDKTASIGLKYIEAYPGQRLSQDKPEDVKFDHNMAPELQQEVLAYLAAKNVKLVNYGVVDIPRDEDKARVVFEFAKAMGIETIVSEPGKPALPVAAKLADEYGINVAIHNHPKPSMYWDYNKVLEATEGLSPRVGSCADTGHWPRSGVNPLEAVKALAEAKRIISFHFKDLNEFGNREAHDVIWGTGVCNVKDILAELKSQNVKGVFSIEYEHNWENSLPEISRCVENFEKFAQELSK